MYDRNLGYRFSLQIGGSKTIYFRRLRNLTATLTVYVFGTKHDIHNRASALETTRGLFTHSQYGITFHLQSIAHALSGINMATHSESE